MASVTVVSPLSLDQQAARLSEFARERGLVLSYTAAAAICETLNLVKPTGSSVAARRLRDALAAHRVHVTYTVALEGLARLCGGENWMRTRQMMLPLDEESGLLGPPLFCLQPERYDGVKLELVPSSCLEDFAPKVIDLVRSTWPAELGLAVCHVTVSKKTVLMEFEHPFAPWFALKCWGFQPTREGDEALPGLIDLPSQAVLRLLGKLTRSLEYQFPGLLVVDPSRSNEFGPDHFLAPEFFVEATGFRQACNTPMDTLFWLGACKSEFDALPGGRFALQTEDQQVELTPRWRSQESGVTVDGSVDADLLHALFNRVQRIERLSGKTLTEFLAGCVNCGASADEMQVLDRDKVHAAMDGQGMPPLALAKKSGLPLNRVMVVVKYGYAPLDCIASLAEALGLTDPNDLLPPEGEHSTGLRVETGETFLRALKHSHAWGRVIGDSIKGEEREEINGIAESLQEYVELLQFSESAVRNEVKTNAPLLLEPMDEARLARDIQDLLDELSERGIAVVVSRGVRFMKTEGSLAHMNKFPMRSGTLYLERIEHLKKAPTVHAE